MTFRVRVRIRVRVRARVRVRVRVRVRMRVRGRVRVSRGQTGGVEGTHPQAGVQGHAIDLVRVGEVARG